MSDFSYAGVGMDIINTRQILREVVKSRDRQVFHLHRWVFDCDFVVNPQATSYLLPGNSNANLPTRSAGRPAVLSDTAIRWRLSQPRQKLTFQVLGNTLLSTPLAGYSCDAAGGPFVENLVVQQIVGTKTILVSGRFTAYVNEAPTFNVARAGGNAQAFPVLLSNQWRRSADQDEDFYVVVETAGEAVFRSDELRARGHTPDNYRAYVVPPPMTGFHREKLQTAVSEDNTTLLYRCYDRELTYNVNPVWKATRVKAFDSRSMSEPSFLDSLSVSIPNGIGRGIMAGASPGVGTGVGLATGGINFAVSNLPTITSTATAQVWGSRQSRRLLLRNLAMGIAFARVGVPRVGAACHATMSSDLSSDGAKYVEFSITHVEKWWPNLGANADAIGAVQGRQPGDQPIDLIARAGFNGFNDDVPGWLQQADAANYVPPNSSGTRGTWDKALVPQTITGPGQTPDAWPEPVANVDELPP